MEIRHYGDLQVHVGDAFDSDGDLAIGGGYIGRAQVHELRDHLSRLLGDAQATDTAPAPAARVEIGREYRLLPGATYRSRSYGARPASIAGTTATRVRVHLGPDRDGDYRVTALDGNALPDAGAYYVSPAFLASLDAPDTAPAPAPDAVETVRAAVEAVAERIAPDPRYPTSLGAMLGMLARELSTRGEL